MNSGEKIRQLLNNPTEPGFEYIADPKDYEREVLHGYKMDVAKYGTGLDRWCPAKLGQLTCIIGHTNVGKTTSILWLLSRLIAQKRKILVYSAENRISSLHNQFTRFVFQQRDITQDHLTEMRKYHRYIKHEKHFTYREILNQATFLLDAGFEFDFLLIDPYNALRIDPASKINTHDYHYQAAEEMRIFTNSTNKSIFLNCHTVTEAQRVKPDANGHRPAPMDSDVEGGGKFPNKADDTIVIHRQISSMIEGEKFVTEIHVRKVRNQEFGGEPTPFNTPYRMRYRIDRTGFDELTGYEGPNEYKSVNFYESEKPF